MARKIEKKKAPVAAEQPSAADDLSVLKPAVTLTIAGRKVTVREYGFFEGLEVAHRCAAFIADMLQMCADGTLRYAAIRRLFGPHCDAVVYAASVAADVEPEWIHGLKPADADHFLSAWFTVNSGFFLREAAVEIEEVRLRERMRASGTSSTSSSASPQPTSRAEVSNASGNSPSAS